MKETTLNRLRRLTNTRITESFMRASTNVTAPDIGQCGEFKNVVYKVNDQPKNFMFFTGKDYLRVFKAASSGFNRVFAFQGAPRVRAVPSFCEVDK